MTTTNVDADEALASLTGALVESNDRLLGLLGLITADAPPSLDAAEMIDWVLDRANSIITLDRVQVSGGVVHTWGRDEACDHAWADQPQTDEASEVRVIYGRDAHRFDTADTKLLAAVTALVASSIATAELHQAQLGQQLVANEHATAARITTLALPSNDTTPQVDGLSLFCDLVPARTTGGDLYTWHELDGDLWFAMGDVSGKGLPAAVLMTTIVSMIEAAMHRCCDDGPSAVIAEVERLMYQRLSDAAMFVTLVLGRWSPETSELHLVNCGHSPVVHCHGGKTSRVSATAPPIGVVQGLLPDQMVVRTEPNDVLVLATDGFTEQTNETGVLFGEDQFDASIAMVTSTTRTAQGIGQDLLDILDEFSAGTEQADDRALMVVRFT